MYNVELINVTFEYGDPAKIIYAFIETNDTSLVEDVIITVLPIEDLLLDAFVAYNRKPTDIDFDRSYRVCVDIILSLGLY